ncbi:MAG TPA: protein kinase, partial [Polyangiaceae bacterium]
MQTGDLVDHRFRVIAAAGQGAFGTVYCVLDERSRQKAALKIFDRPAADLARFAREAELLETLRHPQIVEFVGHGFTEAGIAYLAMEWLEGCNLEEKLRLGPLSRQEA